VGIRVVRRQFQRPAICVDGLVQQLLPAQRVGDSNQRRNRLRFERHLPAIGELRLAEAALLEQDMAKAALRLSQIRCEGHRALGRGDRRPGIALGLQRSCQICFGTD